MAPKLQTLDAAAARTLYAAWISLLLATALLLAAYATLPPDVPLLRSVTGTWVTWALKSPLTVFRIPAMGAGQLGVVTVMLRAACREREVHWMRFWLALAIVAGIKASLETMQLALLSAALPRAAERVFYAATLLPTLAGIGWATHVIWRTRARVRSVPIGRHELLLISVALGLWVGGALLGVLAPNG